MAQEAFFFLKKKRRSRDYACALKLDMNKAYDRVDWSFLVGMLKAFGFNSHWCNLIMECVSSSSISVILNGESLTPFSLFPVG